MTGRQAPFSLSAVHTLATLSAILQRVLPEPVEAATSRPLGQG